MAGKRWPLVTTALCAALTLVSCTDASAGFPVPDHEASGNSTSGPAPTTGQSPAERPRELSLDDADPCELVPSADWPKLGIERAGTRREEPNLKSPQCYYSGVGNVTLVMSEGIEAWTEGNRRFEPETVEPIDEFPTVVMANDAGRACFAAVDVAQGQYLLTTATPNPNDPNQPEKCDLAYQLAESAMTTLAQP